MQKKNINNQFIITQSNRFDHFGVAVNLSRIKYIISHINGHWIPVRGRYKFDLRNFAPPPVKFSLTMACGAATVASLLCDELYHFNNYVDELVD